MFEESPYFTLLDNRSRPLYLNPIGANSPIRIINLIGDIDFIWGSAGSNGYCLSSTYWACAGEPTEGFLIPGRINPSDIIKGSSFLLPSPDTHLVQLSRNPSILQSGPPARPLSCSDQHVSRHSARFVAPLLLREQEPTPQQCEGNVQVFLDSRNCQLRGW